MREGRWADELSFQDRLWPLHDALFTDASPGPVKYALSRVRPEMPGELRLPMNWPSETSQKAVDRALEHAGLICWRVPRMHLSTRRKPSPKTAARAMNTANTRSLASENRLVGKEVVKLCRNR